MVLITILEVATPDDLDINTIQHGHTVSSSCTVPQHLLEHIVWHGAVKSSYENSCIQWKAVTSSHKKVWVRVDW